MGKKNKQKRKRVPKSYAKRLVGETTAFSNHVWKLSLWQVLLGVARRPSMCTWPFKSDFPFIKLCTPENTFLYLHYHYRYFLVVLFCFVFINFCHVYKRVLERIKSKRWEDGFIILLPLFYLVKLFDSQTKFVILLTINHTILMMFVQRIEFWIN